MNSSPSHKRGSSWSSSDGSLSWSSRLPVSAGPKICLKLAIALSLKCHWLHLGKVPQTAWQKECSSGGVAQHNLSTAMNSPTTNISHLDCVWQLQLSVSLEASHLTLNLMIWSFSLLECEWHFFINDSLIFQAWDPLRVRLNWVDVSENIPSKALFILVLDIQDCLLLCNLTREFDVRQFTQCFVPFEMYFEWGYSLKPPVTPFLVITLKLFQNRVHRRLPLLQSFKVSGHLRSGHLWAGSGHLWAGLIRLHCLSSSFRDYHLDLHLTVVSRDLKTSGLTSSVNSLGPYLDYPRFEVALQTFPTRELQIEEVVCTSLRSPSACFSLLILSEKAFAD